MGPALEAAGIWYGFIGGLTTAALLYCIRIVRLFRTRTLPEGMQHSL